MFSLKTGILFVLIAMSGSVLIGLACMAIALPVYISFLLGMMWAVFALLIAVHIGEKRGWEK
jgi:hypothetical protein